MKFISKHLLLFLVCSLLTYAGKAQSPSLEWVRTFTRTAGSPITYPYGVVTDATGNVYTTGIFQFTVDFDPGLGAFNLTSAGNSDIFVSKLGPAGDFLWAVRIGGVSNDTGNGIALDATGNVYVTGSYFGTVDFDPGAGISNLTGGGAFVLKLSASGVFEWAKRIGAGGGNVIDIDTFGDVVTVGTFTGTSDFDPGTPVLNLTSFGSSDIFVSKLTAPLGDLVWVKQMGGTLNDLGASLATDASGNVYTTGSFSGTADFDPGAGVQSRTSAGSNDIFISKLSPAGNFVWANRMGNAASEQGESIAIDPTGNVLTTGNFTGTVDFDPGAGTTNLTSVGSTDIFVSKLDASGLFLWAKNVGSTSIERSHGITTDGSGNVYYTGEFGGITDFDPGAGNFDVTPTLDPAAFVSKLDANGNFQWVVAPRGSGTGFEGVGLAIALDPSANVIAAGWFNNLVDFDPGICDENLTATSDDIYIWKLNPFVLPSTNCAPTITGFAPASGPVGTLVTITGTRFSSIPANNVVYFGATRANVTAATTTALTVNVPVGATYAPITLVVAGAIAYSQRPFVVTFADGGVINTCSFSAPTNYSAGNFGYGLATGDLDLDGKVDIVISNPTAGTLMIFRNTSTMGSIDATSFATSVDLPAGTNVQHVVISDVDGDGKLDLVAAGYDSNIISIYRNIATPGTLTAASFQARVDLATGARPFDVEAADLDGDGKTDIVTSTEGRLSFWRNIGTSGSLTTGSFDTRQDIFINSISVAVSDLDVDGKPDLVIGPALSSVARIYRNISTPGSLVPGSFAAGVDFSVGAWPDYIVTGDLDDDQRPDIITSSWPGGSISILKNTSSPGTIDATSFAPKVDIAGLTEPRGLSITDYDGDSKPDIALAMQISSNINVYKNLSSAGTINSGSFAPVVAFPSGGNLRLVTSADFDGDGKPDLATSNWSGPPLSVLRNQQGTPSITGVAPSSGIMGSSVTITGTNFSTTPSDNIVKFNGLAATVIASTPTSITALVPTNATTGPLTVTKNCLTATSGNFTVLPYTPPCSNLLLNGGTDKVSFADDPSLEPTSVTVEAWVKVNAFTSTKSGGNTSAQFILFKRNQLTVYSEGYSFVLDETTKSFLGVVSSGAGGPPSQRILSTSANLVNLNQWYHLALTADNVEVKFFVNGELIGTLPTGFALNYGPEGLSIGNTSPLNSWQGAFNGNVDEVRIWNFVRSQSQLQSSMTGALAGTEPGLVAYYKMDETGQGAGLTVTNSASATGAINNGVTVGSATTPVFTGSCSCVPTTERDALIALYNATDGANWSDNTGWLNADVSTWYGVTVSGCNVIDIALPGNNLIGSIPPEIGNLTLLEGLDLGANQLNGWIPPEIGNLSALTALNLSINQLEGSVPMELSYLSNLQALGLAFNQLGGNLPVDLMFLNNLTDVFLNNNQFTGDLPLIGGTTANLNTLLAQFNKFSDLPDLNSYSSLGIINVSSNQLTFDDLEPYMGLGGLFYDPQAKVPPGGFVAFIPGNDLLINFSTGGTANSYQWYKNNVLIPGATSTNLLISNATPGDVGLYEVRITNSIVPLLTLSSMTYTVITDPCGVSTPTSGDLDTGFAPLISAPSSFLGVGLQSSGKIITSTSYTIENSTIKSGVLRFNTDGSLDNSFAVNPYAGEVIVQPDNKVLVAYSDGTYAYPVRLNSDGTDDTGFNGNVPQYYSGSISAMAYQSSDNTILVAGGAYMTPLFVERLNPDGTSAGTLPDATDLYVTTIAVQADDYILIGGEFMGGIRRLDPSGVLDPTFIGEASDFVTDIVVQPDGKILVAGLFQFFNDLPHRGIVRLNPDGSIDNTFTVLGITDQIDLGYYPTRMLLQSDDKIILAGLFETINGASRRNLVRLNPDGSVDCSFDPGTSTDDVINALALQTDGKILLASGFTSYQGTQRYGLARVNSVALTGPPTITSFSPATGTIGATITITGTNFSATPANNTVYFGATKTVVTSATTTQLIVTVPSGATYFPITATVNGLTAFSPDPFIPVFAGGSTIDANTFGSQTDFTTADQPIGIVIGDLDLDGKTDLVISSKSGAPGTLSVLRNTSTTGTIDATSFDPAVDFVRSPGNRAGMAIGDLDGDGKPELVAVDLGADVVSVYRNVSTPGVLTLASFAAPLEFATGSVPQNVAIEDLDADGKPEIVTANRIGNTVSVLKNTSTPGSISFASTVDFAAGPGAHDIAIRDLNHDAKPDLAIANESNGTVSILENASSPGAIDATSFSAAINFTTGSFPTKISIGDVDGDGSQDIVTANLGVGNTISILRSQISAGPINAGSFLSAANFVTAAPNNSAELGDLNGDGKIDIATAMNVGPTGVAVLQNTSTPGNLSFNAFVGYTAGASTYEVAIGDLDGDGRPEIATANNAGPSTSVLHFSTLATITITLQPSDAIACEGSTATFTTAATGTTNITYQWQFSPDGIAPFNDLSNGAGYANVTTPSLSVNTTGNFGVGRYRCRINGDNAAEVLTNDEGLFINALPAPPTTTSANRCSSGSLTLTAAGAVNGQYRWYTAPTGGTALAGEVNSTYVTPVITSTTSYYVSIDNGTCESGTRTLITATINTPPSAPIVIGASSCSAASLSLSASGGVNGQYRWYTAATGGTAIAGEVNDTYLTPLLTTSTTYHVAINDGICESTRTPVIAAINTVTKPAVVTSNCTATAATLTGPSGFTIYAWSNGASTQSINVTVAGTYTLVVTASTGCVSPPSDPVVFTAAFCNQPPVIATTTITTTVQSKVTLAASDLTSDLDNNIDLSTLAVVVGPISGANAFFNSKNELVVDYTDVAFAGTDQLTIRVCDIAGACAQEVITIEVGGDITVYNALSPNGDGKNDVFYIQYIDALPDTKQNKVTIFDRWGSVVFEIENYDNGTRVFKGLSNSGTELPNGTYFYSLEFGSGAPKRTGFISLRR